MLDYLVMKWHCIFFPLKPRDHHTPQDELKYFLWSNTWSGVYRPADPMRKEAGAHFREGCKEQRRTGPMIAIDIEQSLPFLLALLILRVVVLL